MSRDNPIEVVFNFVADKPTTILIAGGILFLLLSLLSFTSNLFVSFASLIIGFGLIGLGVLLYLSEHRSR
jgi:uncharacterized membrane protein YczE